MISTVRIDKASIYHNPEPSVNSLANILSVVYFTIGTQKLERFK